MWTVSSIGLLSGDDGWYKSETAPEGRERERESADIYDLREMRSKTSLSAAEQRKKSCHFVSHHLCIQTFSVVLLTALWEVRLSQ